MAKWDYIQGSNAGYVEEMFEQYRLDPSSLETGWRSFFEGLEMGTQIGEKKLNEQLIEDINEEAKVADLINFFRSRGRFLAKLDPLEIRPPQESLKIERFGLSEENLSEEFTAGNMVGLGKATLQEIIDHLTDTYASSIAVEYKHIQQNDRLEWLQKEMEACRNREKLDTKSKMHVLQRLTEAEAFEQFLHTRYVAQKRFSIEGADALIPALDRVIEVAAAGGANNIVMGMAHRGRLNVLTNIFGKKYEYIFTEFDQNYSLNSISGEGDVKYHMGFSSDIDTSSGQSMHLSLANNPSHLEFVNPVVEGVARAKQNDQNDHQREKVIPILIHGDAAFAGQGIVYETLNFSQVPGYWTGGTVHFIIDNQIGFTATSEETRSTVFSTDIAKMLSVPIFHVNADDVEAVYYVSKLAFEYRQRFKCDVFIDLICYRRYGHNESDEPAFTSPLMYKKIKDHPTPREKYTAKLVEESVCSERESQQILEGVQKKLLQAYQYTKEEKPKPVVSAYENTHWKMYHSLHERELFESVDTSVSQERLQRLAERLNHFPEDFNVHPKLKRLFDGRFEAVQQGKALDWGNAETLAYATLLEEGHPVRISGQDVERGTFSHRHAVLHDPQSGERYVPLRHINEFQAPFLIHNSTLSESGVLGFEYGWSIAAPQALVIWEAQFGDFCNGAQVIIDQFLSSGESKWQRASGIVLFLPHGYEGQGPEHSSARPERFLQLCGKNNMYVCNFTTPANLFHGLRRQIVRAFRKPLIVITPKSLLRHNEAVSPIKDLAEGCFEECIEDPFFTSKKARQSVKKILLCTGKVFYDLKSYRDEKKIDNIAILRIEQLYPWPTMQLSSLLELYPDKASIHWVQEEPKNMGAWTFVHSQWTGALGKSFKPQANGRDISYIGRGSGAAPAVGSMKKHRTEQEEIIEKAMTL